MIFTTNFIERGSHWRNFLLAAGVGLALVTVACATDDAEPSDAPSAATSAPAPTAATDTAAADDAEASDEIDSGVASDIEGFKLQNLTVSVGTVISWTNQDSAPHTVTHGVSPDVDSNPAFQSGNFTKGQEFFTTFNTVGIFPYFCEVHPAMTAVVTVESGSAPPVISDTGGDPGY